MEDRATFLCGVPFKMRLLTGQVKILSAAMKDVTLQLDGAVQYTRGGKQRVGLQAKIQNKLFPFRYQTSPLLLANRREGKKGRFKYTVFDFDYKSNLDPQMAIKCRDQLEEADEQVASLLYDNRELIWPGEALSASEIADRYQGFTKDRVWKPPPLPIAQPPQEALEDAVIIDPEGENPKLVYEPGLKKGDGKGSSKKRKAEEQEVDKSESTEIISFPAQLSIFPRTTKKTPCKVFSVDQKPLTLQALSPGLEIVSVFDISLVFVKDVIQLSCTGLQFNIKEDHREILSYLATDPYLPES